MARIRRAALSLLMACMAAGAAAPTGLTLASGRSLGSLVIANHGPAPVTIARAISVEWRDGRKWTAARTEFNAVASCPSPRAPKAAASVSLPTGGSLRVVPWRGYTCSGQCETRCMANIYLGPGMFRFVVTALPDGTRVASPAFTLPPEA